MVQTEKYFLTLHGNSEKDIGAMYQLGKIFGENEVKTFYGFDARKCIFYQPKTWCRIADKWDIDKNHVSVSRIETVFGKKCEDIIDESTLRKLEIRWLLENPGGVGCVISHLLIMKEFLKSKSEVLAIFEHDFITTGNETREEFDNFCKLIAKQNVPSTGLLYSWVKDTKYLVRDTEEKMSDNRSSYVITNSDFYKRISVDRFYRRHRICSTLAYVLNRKAAEEILKVAFPITFSADWFHTLKHYGALDKIFVMDPIWGIPNGQDSTTTNPKVGGNMFHGIAQFVVDNNVPFLSTAVKGIRNYRLGGYNYIKFV